jgi:aspartyl-tRNA(Asn)/glutamyl-tRNA(Gln) amidotransferase subunit B
MMDSGKDAAMVVKEKNLVQVSDQGELLVIIQEIIAANPGQAEDFKNGKTKLMGYFVGQLMQKTKGKANPKVANELFSKELSK